LNNSVVINRNGFDQDRLKRLTASLWGYIERGHVAGVATRVFRNGEMGHSVTLGWQDKEKEIPLQPDSLFRIMSMTKPVIAIAAMILVEEGRLRLDDPVDNWLPELANRQVLRDPAGALDGPAYPSPRPITLRDLLTFRPGIGFLNGDIPYDTATMDLIPAPLSYARITIGSPNKAVDLTPDEWLVEIGKLPLAYQPGERWLYNVASDITGVLVARAAGLDLAGFLQQRLFGPLGMSDTGFVVPPDKLNRLCVGYGTSSLTNQTVVIDHPGNSIHARPPIFPSGAAGLVSTADDYLKFGRMLLGRGKLGNERILSRKTVDLITANHLTEQQQYQAFVESGKWGERGFGFGVSVILKQNQVGPGPGAFTWGGAYGTNWLADPQEDMVIVMMIQQMGGQFKLGEDFTTLVYQAIAD
jgi:CubicO group peptidase (beta-lactamase class C family)